MAESTVLYWDSCLFTDYINATPGHVELIAPILEKAIQDGTIQIVVSSVATVEVAFAAQERSQHVLDTRVEETIDGLWSQHFIEVVEFHSYIARRARELIRWSVGEGIRTLKPMDAIHLATAMYAGVSEVHTFDQQLPSFEQPVGCPICRPYLRQPTLPLA